MLELDTKKNDLIAEKIRRAEKLRSFALRITKLWDRLEISETERKAFFGQNRGLGLATLNCCEREFVRLEALKAEKLKELIERQRTKLHELWDACHYGVMDRLKFAPGSSLNFTEEILEAHETEVAKLKAQFIVLQPIVELILKREQILVEKVEYEEILKNKDRFKIAGWSIKEENFRKILTKELPKLNQKLLEDLEVYEVNYGTFYFEDKNYYEILRAELDAIEEAEENTRQRQELQRSRNFSGSSVLRKQEEIPALKRPGSALSKARVPSNPTTPRRPMTVRQTNTGAPLSAFNTPSLALSRQPASSPENVNRMNLWKEDCDKNASGGVLMTKPERSVLHM